jgi:hypothetical protein
MAGSDRCSTTWPGAITFEPFIGDGRPGDIAAELLQFFTLIGAAAHRRMQAKAVRVATELWGGRPGLARQALQAQHFLPSSWAQRNPIGARGGLQSFERPVGVRFGEVGLLWFFDDSPRRVNKRMTRVMILASMTSSASTMGGAASWKTGTPSRFR